MLELDESLTELEAFSRNFKTIKIFLLRLEDVSLDFESFPCMISSLTNLILLARFPPAFSLHLKINPKVKNLPHFRGMFHM